MRGNLAGFLVALLIPFFLSSLALEASAPAAGALQVWVAGRPVQPEAVVLQAGRILLPARILADLGLAVVELEDGQVRLIGNGRRFVGRVGSESGLLDGKTVALDAPIVVAEQGVMLPLRLLADLGGWRVRFDPSQARLDLYDPAGDGKNHPPGLEDPEPRDVAPAASSPEVPDFAARRRALLERRERLAHRMGSLEGEEPEVTSAAPPDPAAGTRPEAPPAPQPRAGEASPPPAAPPRVPVSLQRTISGIRLGEAGHRPRIEVVADGPLEYTYHLLADPSRLVLDFPGARWEGEPLRLVHPGPVVRRVRGGQQQPDQARIVVDLDAPVRFDAQVHESGLSLSLYQQVGPVRLWESAAGPVVDVAASGPLQPVISTLNDPFRLVVDLPRASLVTSAQEGEAAGTPIRRWRISQFQPETVRLVLELDRPLTVRRTYFIPSEPDEPGGVGWPGYAGVWRLALGPALVGVGLHPVPTGWALLLEAESALEVRPSRLMAPHRVLVDLPGAVLPEDWSPIQVDEPLVQRLRIARNRPDMVRVVLDVSGPMGYRLFRSPGGERLVVLMRPSSLSGRTIVLDPGHGGRDQGAIGVTGLPEAAVNLELARLLGARLDQEGARVLWTRRGDVYVPLEERPRLANLVKADLFLSIHNNSCPADCTGRGTETYFLPKRPENERLAAALQEELVRAIALPDRGVRQQNLSVLRNSEVPAALVEVAFLSAADEEKLLRDPVFLNKAADGLYKGIQRYFAELASDPASNPDELDAAVLAAVEELLNRGLAAAAHRRQVATHPSGDGTGVSSPRAEAERKDEAS